MRKAYFDLAVKWKSMKRWCSDLFDWDVDEARKEDQAQDRYGMRSPPFTFDEKGRKVTWKENKKPN